MFNGFLRAVDCCVCFLAEMEGLLMRAGQSLYRVLFVVIGMGWCLFVLGCEALPLAETSISRMISEESHTEFSEERAGGAEEENANPLRLTLMKDHWTARDLWPEPLAGPQQILKRQTAPQARWVFEPFSPTSTKVASPDVQSSLQALSQEDHLAGWNACILLAWQSREPVSVSVLKRLQELTIDPPLYAEPSGLRVVSPANVNSHKPPSLPAPADDENSFLASLWPHWGREKPVAEENPAEEAPTETTINKEQPSGKPVSEALRAAAAEAWCYQLSLLTGDAEIRFTPAGLALQEKTLPEIVHSELLRGIARKIPPRQIPTANDILSEQQQVTTPTPLTLAALDACLQYAISHQDQLAASIEEACSSTPATPITFDLENLDPAGLWPEALWQYRWLESAEVTNRFGLWLALTGHPLAESYLMQLTQHVEPAVQWQALRSLGLLKSRSVQEFLLKQTREREGVPRAIAVLAAGANNPEMVYSFQNDSSTTVRSMVARYACEHPGPTATQKLTELVNDVDPVVQKEVLQGVQHWENRDVYPILAAGFLSPVLPTRKLARQQLEQRFEIVIASLEDSPAARQQILQSIGERHQLESASVLPQTASETPAATNSSSSSAVSSEDRILLEKLLVRLQDTAAPQNLQQQAGQELEELARQKPRLILEDLQSLHDQALRLRVALYAEWKIAGCEVFGELQQSDVQRRRQAAQSLATEGKQQPLPSWKLQLLAEQMEQEQDIHVCRSFLQAISQDTTPAARNIAMAALLHSWPDVRILGCRYVEEQRLPQLAPFLLPLLQERNSMVQLAAIRAAGMCRNPVVIDGFQESVTTSSTNPVTSTSGGLRSLLGTVPPATEFEVIAGLARLGDEQGLSELRKLCYTPSPELRGQAVALQGELGQEASVDSLIRLGWTEKHPAVRQAILQSLNQLVPLEQRPDITSAFTYETKMQAWSTWAEQP